ncbi:PREDICTED: uncharacterized protein LOC106300940 isoform X3 [Brassica oleracea var. oleracea]|uniref:uncharacterized protein LOC106300940 isoform X3 n=1 Tax=Brassica oleracea var. oleracea TaxID=109376 RepID=UPI0006A6C133|nr:PREDICTED: uncharacterized protein LOC106300940 isoform X3 [Brassica oleracea var. oleracea]
MASPSAVYENRKSDDLEIVSVGALYSGSCDKKEKIISLILWAIKLFELTMGAHIIWRLKRVLKYLCFCSNSALILWKTVSCAALRTSKRGMAVATHAELLAAENELLAVEGTSVMKGAV